MDLTSLVHFSLDANLMLMRDLPGWLKDSTLLMKPFSFTTSLASIEKCWYGEPPFRSTLWVKFFLAQSKGASAHPQLYCLISSYLSLCLTYTTSSKIRS